MPEKITVDEVNHLDKGEFVARFGFPLVMAARDNTRETIFADAAAQLKHSRSEEMETALSEIAKIPYFSCRTSSSCTRKKNERRRAPGR